MFLPTDEDLDAAITENDNRYNPKDIDVAKEAEIVIKEVEKEVESKSFLSSVIDRVGRFTSITKVAKDMFDDLVLFKDMVSAHLHGHYSLPKSRLVLIVAALIYVVNPIDVIPDTIPILGYVDDIMIFNYIKKMLLKELAEFRSWRINNKDINIHSSKKRAKFDDDNSICKCPCPCSIC